MEWAQEFTDQVLDYNVSWSYVGPCSEPAVSSADDGHQLLRGSTRAFVLGNLSPNSQYLVTVEAINGAGSSASQVTVNTTLQGKPALEDQLIYSDFLISFHYKSSRVVFM